MGKRYTRQGSGGGSNVWLAKKGDAGGRSVGKSIDMADPALNPPSIVSRRSPLHSLLSSSHYVFLRYFRCQSSLPFPSLSYISYIPLYSTGAYSLQSRLPKGPPNNRHTLVSPSVSIPSDPSSMSFHRTSCTFAISGMSLTPKVCPQISSYVFPKTLSFVLFSR